MIDVYWRARAHKGASRGVDDWLESCGSLRQIASKPLRRLKALRRLQPVRRGDKRAARRV